VPELPEIVLRAREANAALPGRGIIAVEVRQPKILDRSPGEFADRLAGQVFAAAEQRGKWLCCRLDRDWLLVNFGMGGELLLHAAGDPLPENVRAVIALDDGRHLSLHFWWFRSVDYVKDMAVHTVACKLGPYALAYRCRSKTPLNGLRRAIRSLLLDPHRALGIGTVYVQTLSRAKTQPLRPIPSQGEEKIAALWQALRDVLHTSSEAGGAPFELNLRRQERRWDDPSCSSGRRGAPRQDCRTLLAQIRTLESTSNHVCPGYQGL